MKDPYIFARLVDHFPPDFLASLADRGALTFERHGARYRLLAGPQRALLAEALAPNVQVGAYLIVEKLR